MSVFRALVITPQLVEYRAIVQSFRSTALASRKSSSDGEDGSRHCRILVSERDSEVEFDVVKPPRLGRTEAAIAVTRYFDRSGTPSVVIVAGGAGGIGLKLGTFVVASEVLDLSTERRTGTNGVEFRASIHHCNRDVISVFSSVGAEAHLEIREGQVLSSDYVVASSHFRDSLREAFPRVVAVEMEAGGVALAISRTDRKMPLAVVRSIVDMSDENKRADSDIHAGPSYLRLGELIRHGVMRLANPE